MTNKKLKESVRFLTFHSFLRIVTIFPIYIFRKEILSFDVKSILEKKYKYYSKFTIKFQK